MYPHTCNTRWSREEGFSEKRDFPISFSTSGKDAGFRTGHVPSKAIPGLSIFSGVDAADSGSDMDISSDSETGGGPYSYVSSPQDEKTVHHIMEFDNRTTDVPGITQFGVDNFMNADMLPDQMIYGRSELSSAPPFITSGLKTNETDDHILNPEKGPNTGFGVRSSTVSFPACLPNYHASGQGVWCAVIAYDACVRLCLNAWAQGHSIEEAPYFLNDECKLFRDSFGLCQVLLRSEEEFLEKQASAVTSDHAATTKSRKSCSKIKVQVRKVRIGLDPPIGCSYSSLMPSKVKLESLHTRFSNLKSELSSGWKDARKIRVNPQILENGSFSDRSLAYIRARSDQYMKQASSVLKIGVSSLRTSSSTNYKVVKETFFCSLRLKSSSEEDAVRIQPGSGEDHIFFPDSPRDDLIIEVQDSKGQYIGRVLAQVASLADDPDDKLRWWPIYHEPEHEVIGKIQLYINYSSTADDNTHLKYGSVAETMAYDFVLEVAMKAQHFGQRNMLLQGSWKWLVTEFASYYGISDAYTKLRYLSYVMDVATPTQDCLSLVHELLLPVLMKGKTTLSHQENRILLEIEDEVEQILALVFENYKSLDESSPSGMMDIYIPATGSVPPALTPAVKLYTLLFDVLSSEAQLKLCRFFQAAVKRRSRMLLTELDEFITDSITLHTSYQKMKSLVLSIGNEILTDIEIYNQNIVPSFLDLPKLSSSIYSVDLCSKLHEFLNSHPPLGPLPSAVELVIAMADFQQNLADWKIIPTKGGVDAKELFRSYITHWIQDKRLALLELCKSDKVHWSGVRSESSTMLFVDDMYNRIKDALNEFEIILIRWPEYMPILENAMADVEKTVIESLEKRCNDVLSPLKENLTPKMLALKYVHKISRHPNDPYILPDEMGIFLNTMKRVLDELRPKIETKLKSWSSYIPNGGRLGATVQLGECFGEVNLMIRAKFRSYLHAIVEKLAENTRIHNGTKLRKIIDDSKEDSMLESDVRSRMEPLKDLLIKTVDHVHSVVQPFVLISICRGLWDRMGQDLLHFLETRRENMSWYKGLRIAVSVLDDVFASEMQKLLGNGVKEKELEAPRSIMEVRSVLCKDAVNNYIG